MTHDGVANIVSFAKGDRLQLSTTGGREEWTSSDAYGGNQNFLITPEEYRDGQKLETSMSPIPCP